MFLIGNSGWLRRGWHLENPRYEMLYASLERNAIFSFSSKVNPPSAGFFVPLRCFMKIQKLINSSDKRFHVSFIDGGPVETVSTILSGKSKLPKMLDEVENNSNDKIPVLIFKFDRTKFYVASRNLPDGITRICLGEIKIGMLDDVVEWLVN